MVDGGNASTVNVFPRPRIPPATSLVRDGGSIKASNTLVHYAIYVLPLLLAVVGWGLYYWSNTSWTIELDHHKDLADTHKLVQDLKNLKGTTITCEIKDVVSCAAIIPVHSGKNGYHKYNVKLTSGGTQNDNLALKFIDDPLNIFNKSKFQSMDNVVNKLWMENCGLEKMLQEVRGLLESMTRK